MVQGLRGSCDLSEEGAKDLSDYLGQRNGVQGQGGSMGSREDSSLGEGCRRGCRVWEGVVTRGKGVQRVWVA